MRQSLDVWSHPMCGGPLLAGRDPGMLATYLPAALPAVASLHRVASDFGLWLRRNVCDGDDFPPAFSQPAATVRTTLHVDRHIYRLHVCGLLGRVPEPEEPLSRFSSGPLRVRLPRAFRKRRCSTSALQLLDFGPKSLDHSVLVKNDLNQFFAAQRFQMFQDPGCINSSVISRTFKSSDTLFRPRPLIKYD
jgi:hypothetical protein